MRQLTVRTKAGTVEPFRPNWAQTDFFRKVEQHRKQGKPQRFIILKARQLGISTAVQALMFWNAFTWDHHLGLVMAHSTDSTAHIFSMTRMFWDYFPYRRLFTPKYASKRELSWTETRSVLHVATAGKTSNSGIGRGRTINDLHASEVAFWEKPKDTMLGLRQTIPQSPGTLIVLESTANGVGNWFHEQWQEAQQGDSDYVPLFYPWFKHHEYTASSAGLSVDLSRLDAEEHELRHKWGVGDDHLRWRRWAIVNLTDNSADKFRQEYPTYAEEAFLLSGTNVFDLERLRVCWVPMDGARGVLGPDDNGIIRFRPDITGPFTIFRKPSRDREYGQYAIGGDPAHAGGNDYACIQVINRRTFEQVAVWRGKIDPVTFADELVKVGRFYNDALIAPEVTGPGYATVGRLLSLDYPHLWRQRYADRTPGKMQEMWGWSTNTTRKQWAIGDLNKLVVDNSLTIHERGTFEEMRAYVNLPAGGFGPASEDGYDDRVMALAIACVTSRSEGDLLPYIGGVTSESAEPQAPPWEQWADVVAAQQAVQAAQD